MAEYLVFQAPEREPIVITAGYVEADNEEAAVAAGARLVGLTLDPNRAVHAVLVEDAAHFVHEITAAFLPVEDWVSPTSLPPADAEEM